MASPLRRARPRAAASRARPSAITCSNISPDGEQNQHEATRREDWTEARRSDGGGAGQSRRPVRQAGYAATSLQDIANEVGLSRTSIYYYFTSKEAVLEELVRGVTQWPAKIFSELEGAGESEMDRVTEAARQLVLWVTDPHTHFKLMDRAESDLPEQLAGLLQDAGSVAAAIRDNLDMLDLLNGRDKRGHADH